MIDVVDRVGPAVVGLAVRTPSSLARNGRPEHPRGGSGSGVVVAPDGLILTNSHVAGPAGSGARIAVTTADGQDLSARLVGDDPDTDLALIRIDEAVTLAAAPLGDSKRLKRGPTSDRHRQPVRLRIDGHDWCGVGARPFAARTYWPPDRRPDPDRRRTQSRQFRRAARLLAREVVGINTAVIMGAQGICFAVAANTASFVLGELVRHGRVRRAFIGISAQQTAIPARRRRAVDLVQESAVMVATVESGSAADRAGLKPGDIVLRLDGEISPAPTISSARSLARRIGKSVALDVLRGFERLTVSLVPEERRRAA